MGDNNKKKKPPLRNLRNIEYQPLTTIKIAFDSAG